MNRFSKAWKYLWNGAEAQMSKPVDMFIAEENAIKNEIVKILKKKDTHVSMAPRSNKFFIVNKSIKVKMLINGDAEFIKMSNHDWKYGWKFRSDFINNVIKLVIDWIEEDRTRMEHESFEDEIGLIKKIGGLIDSLDDAEPKKLVEFEELKKSTENIIG